MGESFLTEPRAGSDAAGRAALLAREVQAHRPDLMAYCYRMLGSGADADDAVQLTFERAWRSFERFEGRSPVRSWLFRIATNVCFDLLRGRQRRALPMDLGPAGDGGSTFGAPRPEPVWIQPVPDTSVIPGDGDPADVAIARETLRLAFVAALQHLRPRQRAVLVLRDVLRWKAGETAELLDTSVVAVNGLLRRARATLAEHDVRSGRPARPLDEPDRALVARYLDAFERFDVDALVSLVHEDATLSMPPYELWLHGRAAIGRWLRREDSACRSMVVVPVAANGAPALAAYRHGPGDAGATAFCIQILGCADGRVTSIHTFLDTRLFARFGLAATLVPSRAQPELVSR